jgi:hypothetical protein
MADGPEGGDLVRGLLSAILKALSVWCWGKVKRMVLLWRYISYKAEGKQEADILGRGLGTIFWQIALLHSTSTPLFESYCITPTNICLPVLTLEMLYFFGILCVGEKHDNDVIMP